MKTINESREWYQSKKGHCDALIKDIVLLGHKAHGENKEDRSHQEEMFIKGLENLKGYVDRLEDQVNLPGKLEEAIKVLAMVAKWGIGNNDDIIKVIENIKNSLEEQARSAKEEDIQPSLELLEKQAPLKNTIAVINFKQIKGILTRRVEEQEKNKNELSIRNENNQQSVYDVVGLRLLIAEFLEDVRDKIIFLFRPSKSLAIDSKITGNLNLYPYRYVITSRVFKDLMNKTLRLKEVSLYDCKQLVNNDIESLVKQHATLTSLNLRETNITDEGLVALAPYLLENLTSLDLSDTHITGEGFAALAPHLGNLTFLGLQDTNITDEGLKALAPSLGNLTSLNLAMCFNITDEGLAALAKSCRNLTSLNLNQTQITDEGLKALAKNCRNLTSLYLSWCENITDEGLKAVAKSYRNLTSLNLDMCISITDEVLKALAENCKNLTSLNLAMCFNITDEGLAALAKSCRNLTSLNLNQTQITDEGLTVLPYYLGNLTSLDLRGCYQTDKGLKAIVKGCPKLKILKGGDLNRLRSEIEQEEGSNFFNFTQRKESTCDRLRSCVLQ